MVLTPAQRGLVLYKLVLYKKDTDRDKGLFCGPKIEAPGVNENAVIVQEDARPTGFERLAFQSLPNVFQEVRFDVIQVQGKEPLCPPGPHV
jgi:hypothetical protein